MIIKDLEEIQPEATNADDNVSEARLSESVDKESQQKKYPYPKSVFFIVSNEFCERFNYYGMRTVLTLYLTNVLLYNDTDATVVYHAFSVFVYFFPICGAILSDSWLGKFRTIFYMSIIYAIGSALISITSVEELHIPQREFTMIGLLLVALGTGGIKPCVSAFGGDQFKMPQQAVQLAGFFSLFYFSINSGSLISTTITPILRENVHCFGSDSCFPLAFGVPSVLMALSIVIFVLGRPMYTIKKPEGNILLRVMKCISYALKNRSKSEKKVDHWLDRSEEKFGKKLVDDVKVTLRILVLYIPLPIFWSLYDQQGSVWTLQANKMDGDIGFYTILPDQMQVVNPLLILIFIPLFTYVVYPLFNKCHLPLRTPLQRMVCGGFLAAAAFLVSAGVSTAIENGEPVLPSSGSAQLRFYNPSPCKFMIHPPQQEFEMFDLKPLEMGYKEVSVDKPFDLEVMFMSYDNETCSDTTVMSKIEGGNAYFAFVVSYQKETQLHLDAVNNTVDGQPMMRTISYDGSAVTYIKDDNVTVINAKDTELYEFEAGTYNYNNQELHFKDSGVYTVMINGKDAKQGTVLVTDKVNLLWQLPQYGVLTAAEIMFAIPGLEFSYSQAPVEMKSVLQSAWLFTTAVGNVVIIIIESARIFSKASYDLILFAGLMVLDIFFFAFLAYRYKYVDQSNSSVSDSVSDDLALEEKKRDSNGGLENPALQSNDES